MKKKLIIVIFLMIINPENYTKGNKVNKTIEEYKQEAKFYENKTRLNVALIIYNMKKESDDED